MRGWREGGLGEREGLERGRGWREGGVGEREGLERGRGWREGGVGERGEVGQRGRDARRKGCKREDKQRK